MDDVKQTESEQEDAPEVIRAVRDDSWIRDNADLSALQRAVDYADADVLTALRTAGLDSFDAILAAPVEDVEEAVGDVVLAGDIRTCASRAFGVL